VATTSTVPSASASQERGDVLVGAERRVDLEGRVVAGHLVGGQQQVVRCHLRGDVDAASLGPAEHVDGLGGGDVADVQPGAGQLGELDVAGDDGGLGDRGPAGQAETSRQLTLVAAGVAPGQPRVLGVLGDHPVERPDVLQGPAHQPRIGDAVAVVGEHPDRGRGAGHQPELGQLTPGQALADRAHGDDLSCPSRRPSAATCSAASAVSVTGSVFAIASTAVKPPRRGRGAAGVGLRVLAPRLAQVGVQVDEPRQRDEAVRVHPLDVGSRRWRGRRSGRRAAAGRPDRAEQVGAGDQHVGHQRSPRGVAGASSPPSSW
jgi:hypothetical protein